jgi:S-adenosylmethionine synthetase
VPESRLAEVVREHFPLTPTGIIDYLQLRRPVFRRTAAYGHFGRNEPTFTWEATHVAEALAREVNV